VSVRYADAIIAVSQAGTEHIAKTYRRPVHHLPNGPGRLNRRPPGKCMSQLGLTPGGFLLSVGRLSPEKCLEDLIDAAAEALPQTPLVLVGDTSFTDEYIVRLHSRAGPQVVFPGYLRGEALEELYSSALVYVIASEMEGLSVSLLEAMSLGCAVLVSDIPGNREALGDPPAGLTFPVHDCAALASALREFAGDASLRASCGRTASERVRLTFDWDAVAAATKEVYEMALARDAARSPG